ncbi:MAG: LmeA family phospholipid-binding protein, partial [Cyanobacteria bacterium P01_E01_bin.48]
VSISEADLNASLRMPEILEQFQGLSADLPLGQTQDESQVLDLVAPEVDFLAGNRLELSAQLVSRNPESDAPVTADDILDVKFTADVTVERGQRLRLVNPEFEFDEVPVPRELSDAFLGGLNEALDLGDLEEQGILARVLSLEISEDKLEVVGFIQVDSFADLQGD